MSDQAAIANRDVLERALRGPLASELEKQFARYLALVLAENERAGLTSLDRADAIVERHFAESVALLSLMREHPWTAPILEGGARLADIGSGGGFPGVPMRLAEPALQLTLIESHGRRAAFLETLVATLDLDRVEVVRARAEEAGRDPSSREAFDLVTARAVAPLVVLVEYAVPLLRPGGVLVTPKGSSVEDEIADAAGALDMLRAEVAQPIVLPAVSDRERTEREEAERPRVVIVRRVGDLDDRYPRRPGIPSKRPLGGSRAPGGAR